MATGSYPLPAWAWTAADGTAGNAAPAAILVKGTQTPAAFYRAWSFDPGTDERLFTTFIVPVNYASGGTLLINWQTNDTGATENPIWSAQVSCVTPADTDTPNEHAFSTAATDNDVANSTEANRLIQSSIALNMDSAAAGDLMTIHFSRDADNGSDDLSSDAVMIACEFQFTTT